MQLSSQYAPTNKVSTQNYITLRPHALVLTTDRDIIHVMCKSAANFLLLFMSHLFLLLLYFVDFLVVLIVIIFSIMYSSSFVPIIFFYWHG